MSLKVDRGKRSGETSCNVFVASIKPSAYISVYDRRIHARDFGSGTRVQVHTDYIRQCSFCLKLSRPTNTQRRNQPSKSSIVLKSDMLPSPSAEYGFPLLLGRKRAGDCCATMAECFATILGKRGLARLLSSLQDHTSSAACARELYKPP